MTRSYSQPLRFIILVSLCCFASALVADVVPPPPGVTFRTLNEIQARAILRKSGQAKLANSWAVHGNEEWYKGKCLVERSLEIFSRPTQTAHGLFRSTVTHIESSLKTEQPHICSKLPAAKITRTLAATFSDETGKNKPFPKSYKTFFSVGSADITDAELMRTKKAVRIAQRCIRNADKCPVSIGFENASGWIHRHFSEIRPNNIRAIGKGGIMLHPPAPTGQPSIELVFKSATEASINMNIYGKDGPVKTIEFFVMVP